MGRKKRGGTKIRLDNAATWLVSRWKERGGFHADARNVRKPPEEDLWYSLRRRVRVRYIGCNSDGACMMQRRMCNLYD